MELGLVGLLVLMVVIGGLFAFLRRRAEEAVASRSVQLNGPLSPDAPPEDLIQEAAQRADDSVKFAGLTVTGSLLMAFALSLWLFGFLVAVLTRDGNVGPVFRSLALLPGLSGGLLFLAGVVLNALGRRGG